MERALSKLRVHEGEEPDQTLVEANAQDPLVTCAGSFLWSPHFLSSFLKVLFVFFFEIFGGGIKKNPPFVYVTRVFVVFAVFFTVFHHFFRTTKNAIFQKTKWAGFQKILFTCAANQIRKFQETFGRKNAKKTEKRRKKRKTEKRRKKKTQKKRKKRKKKIRSRRLSDFFAFFLSFPFPVHLLCFGLGWSWTRVSTTARPW